MGSPLISSLGPGFSELLEPSLLEAWPPAFSCRFTPSGRKHRCLWDQQIRSERNVVEGRMQPFCKTPVSKSCTHPAARLRVPLNLPATTSLC